MSLSEWMQTNFLLAAMKKNAGAYLADLAFAGTMAFCCGRSVRHVATANRRRGEAPNAGRIRFEIAANPSRQCARHNNLEKYVASRMVYLKRAALLGWGEMSSCSRHFKAKAINGTKQLRQVVRVINEDVGAMAL